MADQPKDRTSNQTENDTPRPEADPTGRWVLFATISASSMAFISGSALNVALPAIQRDLGATGADLLWIVNLYSLLLAALILVGGSLGDLFGRKRVYMIGIAIFTLTSIICGLAPSTSVLIAARGAQGIGGAMMIPGSLAIISAYFSDEQRGQAIGTWSAFTTLTSVLGPVLGGVLAENGLWRAIFFIVVPLAIGAFFALLRYVPESRDEESPRHLDIIGALIVTLGMAGVTYGAIEIGRVGVQTGFGRPELVGALMGGIILLIVFVIYESRTDTPMMPLRLFRSRTFSGTNLLTFFLYGALGAALFFLPLNLVQIQGYGETLAGFALLPFSVLLILLSRWAGGLVDRVGPRLPLTVGPLIVAVGFGALALPGITDGPSDYWVTYFPGAALLGLGMGFTVAPLTTAVMGSVPKHNSGVASGINNALSRTSQVLSTAVMGGLALAIFGAALSSNLMMTDLTANTQQTILERAEDLGNTGVPDDLDSERTESARTAIDLAFIDMFRVMMLIAAGMCVLSAVLAGIFVEKTLSPPQEAREET